MIGQAKLLSALTRLVRRTRADGVIACAHAKTRRVFRFAYQAIHQDLVQESVEVRVKAVRDHRVGVAGTDTLDPPALARCAAAALAIARHCPRQQRLPSLPEPSQVTSARGHVAATASASAESLVRALKSLVQICQGAGAELAGSLLTGEDECAVATSAGTACYAASTVSGAKLVTMYGALSGFASGVHPDIRRLDLEGLLHRSLSQSLHRRAPQAVPLGAYEVILEPEAVAELVSWLGSTAFGAKAVHERTSFLAGRMGERVMDTSITIYDDGTEAGMLRLPFDFEGVPKRRTVLIDRGVAAGMVYDTEYGDRFGRRSTGHAMPPDEVEGPFPLHLGMAPGKASTASLIRGCKRGLLIPRFHYVNGLLNPRQALMTGLTREGTCLIERGELAAPVKTLRFTQSLLEAFSRVRGVSKERRLVADPSQELGCAVMPALHLEALKFTGRSEAS
jgi:predicted Zn-dependent protease